MNSSFAAPALMPMPAVVNWNDGRVAPAPVRFAIRGHDDARLRAGLARALRRAEERTGFTFARLPNGEYEIASDATDAGLVIECAAAGLAIPALGEDESYALEVTTERAFLRAPTVLGALHGFETLLQLLQPDSAGGWFLPVVSIQDRPRFPWRGLLIDVARHWQPMEVIKRNLDGMALVKLNVLHLHLTEDQGFRIESKTFPRLHQLGSDGKFFTQEQMREIIAYAAARGIRVVPEFDIPGHATSWVVGHPELASAPGPYSIERRWGIFDPVLDPTNPEVYRVLEGFLGEMAALFPDSYIHIGGDENNGVHWNANVKIQAYIREHNLKDNAGLHAAFNKRVHAILAKSGKRLIGWDEVLHPDLPADSVVHSWRGPEGIADATKRGFATILSNGYYIDLCHPASEHYLNDPVPPGSPLTPAQEKLVLGGEATMWAEWVTPETIDSRIWPRTAAIAERLWSPREVRDVPDMYRRLAITSVRLEESGLSLTRHVDFMLRRFAGDAGNIYRLTDLRTIADLVEPVKGYARGGEQPKATQFTPLTGFVDCAGPDSEDARDFAALVDRQLLGDIPRPWPEVVGNMVRWKRCAENLRDESAEKSPRIHGLVPLLDRIASACAVGMQAAQFLEDAKSPPAKWADDAFAALTAAAVPHDACELPIIPALRRLVAAAALQSERAKLSPDEWRKRVEALALPK